MNLTETTKGTYGGFQDVEFDRDGNVYVVGTFPSSILRVEDNGTKVNEWFNSNGNHTVNGFQGLAATGDILLANDNAHSPNGSLVKFDMMASKGLPTVVPISPPRSITGSDAICEWLIIARDIYTYKLWRYCDMLLPHINGHALQRR